MNVSICLFVLNCNTGTSLNILLQLRMQKQRLNKFAHSIFDVHFHFVLPLLVTWN